MASRCSRVAVFLGTLAAGLVGAADAAETGPVVAAFQRFHLDADADPAAGGRLLLSELNCTSCHKADGAVAAWIGGKPAPVLDSVALRIKPDFLRRFLAEPHAVKPGATMPQVFAGVDPAARAEQVEALTHYLAFGGTVPELRSDASQAKKGEELFHTIGCVACHDSRRGDAKPLPTSVPLPDLSAKYSIISLAEFLQNPHAVRPGMRMPDFNLKEEPARQIAHYLIPNADPRPLDPRVAYKIHHGGFGELPDFSKLTPVSEGVADGFDIAVAGRSSDFAVVFTTFLKIDRAGQYVFEIGSDDGSKLFVDNRLIANNDGVHPYGVKRNSTRLEAGVHEVRVEFAQVAGDQKLTVDFEGSGIPKQPLANLVYPTAEAKRPESKPGEGPFQPDPMLVKKGRGLFASLGCAACHQKQEGESAIESSKFAPAFSELLKHPDAARGCLAETPKTPAVAYGLTPIQRRTIHAALTDLAGQTEPPSNAERIGQTLAQFNCVACHDRAGHGGVEPERNAFFATTVPEMGDEGRIPPHLTSVGDKLRNDWLRHVFADGADDRTYMKTRMPKFGDPVAFLADAFTKIDERTEAPLPELDLPKSRAESTGRQLVGDSALSCVKCHNFGQFAGTGIQAIDLTTMTKRLRADWYHRYMLDPQAYRPGTRMPLMFPRGKSVLRDVLGGNADQQLAATWDYLELGANAPIPTGVVNGAIVLTPTDRPIVYRNFLEGLSPRAIAVGYPEKANLAFDAEKLSLALVWHNAFIDASKHWNGRGQGNQKPLGDHVLKLADGVPLAVLADDKTPWPTASAKDQGWRFAGYRLDEQGRPRFRYATDAVAVEDFPEPIPASAGRPDAGFRRTLSVTPAKLGSRPDGLTFRAAVGGTIEDLGDRRYRIDDALTIRVSPGGPSPIVRESQGKKELLVPLASKGDAATATVEYSW